MVGEIELRAQQAAIVVVGHFNPLIFQPEWLAANDLIGRQEADAAKEADLLLHPQMAVVTLSRARLQVSDDKFDFMATEAPLVSAKDFVVKCFTLLSHTPVTQMGINFITTFRPPDRDAWNVLGDALAPKEPWLPLLGREEGERTGGLRSISIERSVREDGLAGNRTARLRVLDANYMDTAIDLNDHFVFEGDTRAAKAVEVLQEKWDAAERDFEQIFTNLTGYCRGS